MNNGGLNDKPAGTYARGTFLSVQVTEKLRPDRFSLFESIIFLIFKNLICGNIPDYYCSNIRKGVIQFIQP